jgi:MarR family transcriptional regulator for hemolysin
MNQLLTLFTRAAKLLRAAADDAMSAHGVRVGQNIVLEALWETDGLTPGQIAQRAGLATPTVVNTTTRMEAAGLTVRRPDPNDARLVRVHLTERGLAVRTVIEAERNELARRVTASLTEDEHRHLHSALKKIIDELAADPGVPQDDRRR